MPKISAEYSSYITKMLIWVRNNKSCLKTCTAKVKQFKPYNKTCDADDAIVTSFIEQLPAVPSHYCRNKSNKLYLPQEFRNIKGVYKCYTKHLQSINKEEAKVSLYVFRNIFKNRFHIGFHLPKRQMRNLRKL